MQSYCKEIKFWVYKGRKTRAPKNSWKNISFVNFRHRELEKNDFNFSFFRNRLTVNISFASRCRWRSTTDFRFRTPEATTEGETTFFLPPLFFCSLLLQVILFIIFSLILVKNLISFLLLATMQRPNVLSLVSSLSYRAFWWRCWVLWCQEVSLMSVLKDIRSINVVSTSWVFT